VLQAYQELATILLNYHICRIVLGTMCVGVSVWLGWSGIRVAGLSGASDYSVELPHLSYCSWFDVCWSFSVIGLEWYPCCRVQPATRIPLYHCTEGKLGPRGGLDGCEKSRLHGDSIPGPSST